MSDSYDIAELLAARVRSDARISTLVSDRISPDVLPQGESLPAVRYATIFSDPWLVLSGANSAAQTRVQFDAYADTRREANHIAHLIRDVLHGFGGVALGDDDQVFVSDCAIDNRWDQTDQPAAGSDSWRYIRKIDFLVSHSEPAPSLTVQE